MSAALDPAAVAKGLTKAQRRLITGDFVSPFSARSYGQLRAALVRKGLFEPVIGVTPLGLAVRAHLENTDAD
jgi:hypothetical protein